MDDNIEEPQPEPVDEPRPKVKRAARKAAAPRIPEDDHQGKPAKTAPRSDSPPPAIVQKHGDWYLVTYGTWQISVAPDGLMMLPRHLHPDELADFIACAQVAADVSNKVREGNQAREAARLARVAKAAPERPAGGRRRAIVTQGPPPEGTTRMRAVSRQQGGAAIGRAKGRGSRHAVQPAPDGPSGRQGGN